jgi:hypothetical protein
MFQCEIIFKAYSVHEHWLEWVLCPSLSPIGSLLHFRQSRAIVAQRQVVKTCKSFFFPFETKKMVLRAAIHLSVWGKSEIF